MKLFEVFGIVNIDDKKASNSLNNIEGKAKKFGRNTKKVFLAVKKASIAFGAALAGVSILAVKNFEMQEKAETRLESIALRVTKATKGQIESLKELSRETQRYTSFGDDVVMSGQSQLLSFGLTTEQTEKLTGSLVDLLAATKGINASQEDAINAANMLGKAFSGQAGALSRAGIIMNDTQEQIIKTGNATERAAAIAEIMEQNYGGLAEGMANTSSGLRKRIANAFGDITERLANKFMPVVKETLEYILANMPSIEMAIDKTFTFFGGMITWLYDKYTTVLKPLFLNLKDTIDEVMPIILERFDSFMIKLEDFKTIMQPLFEETILPLFGQLYDIIENLLNPALSKFFETSIENAPKTKEMYGELLASVSELLTEINELIIVLGPVIKFLIDVLAKGLIIQLKNTVTNIKLVVKAFNIILKPINAVIEAISKAITGFKELFNIQDKEININVNETTSKVNLDGRRANGGPVRKNGAYMVNEKEQEIFIPNQNGMIANKKQASKLGSTINLIIKDAKVFDTRDADRLGEMLVTTLRRKGLSVNG